MPGSEFSQRGALPDEALLWRLGETPRSLESVITDLILKVLEFRGWNQNHAAKDLQMSVRTLRSRLKKLRESGYQIPHLVGAPGRGGYSVGEYKRMGSASPPKSEAEGT
jgi:hypothetical protein